LTSKLREQGSWCGETHLQKAMYLLQEIALVPTAYSFILYKHGPFSFDLRDDITALRADGVLALEPQEEPYGPKLVPTDGADRLHRVFPSTLKKYKDQTNRVAAIVGDKGVSELEKLATALYVTKEVNPSTDIAPRAKRVCALKPHISFAAAEESLIAVDGMLKPKRLANGRKTAS